jgi:formylglycine-generating enzyme required for sulfatase activity
MRRHDYLIFGIIFLLFVGGVILLLFRPDLQVLPEDLRPTQTSNPDLAIGSMSISAKDGMVMVFVPPGEFNMGTYQGAANERPEHTVYLDAYWIDQFEVTNKMYRKCVTEGGCTPPSKSGSETRSNYLYNSFFNDYPVIYVDWQQAQEYCQWAGRRLPTEAEWEKAARGTDGQAYPWEDQQPSVKFLNFNGEFGDTMSVGNFPDGASPYLALDMAGNVFEWVADCFGSNYYRFSPHQNPQGPSTCDHGHRVFRGGYSWQISPHSSPGIADRMNNEATATGADLGFRCAISANAEDIAISVHQGAYFGQTLPGPSPKPFAPEIFSPTGAYRFLLHSSLYFSSNGKMVLFAQQSKKTAEVKATLMEQGESGIWGAPQEVGLPMDSGDLVWRTPVDGSLRLYTFTDQLGLTRSPMSGDFQLWFVDWQRGHWSPPYSVKDSTLVDGLIYFSANIDADVGGEDIYVLEIKDGQEKKPINIGAPINTDADEYVAVVPEDQAFIIFYRYHPEDKDSRGLYLSFHGEDLPWSQPIFLDSVFGFNHEGFDASISPDGKYLFVLERGLGLYWMDIAGIEALALE